MVALRDGRKLLGVLRSWDQFGMATTYLFWAAHGMELTPPSQLGAAVHNREDICAS